MENHINYLTNLIYDSLKTITDTNNNIQMASVFELYTAIILSKKYNKKFITWSKLLPTCKEEMQKLGYTRTDKGCDGLDIETYTNIFQSKLYSETNRITWSHLTNFYGYTGLSPNLKLDLCRTKCKIDIDAEKLIKNGHITDHQIKKEDFLSYVADIVRSYTVNQEVKQEIDQEINQETTEYILKPYQVEAHNAMEKYRKIILNIPTGLGKTLIILIDIINKINNSETEIKYLVFVPTIVLLEQWYNEATILNIPTYCIGSGYNNKITLKTLEKYNLILCVNNSVDVIEKYIGKFDKIIFDEAHRIFKPDLYAYNEDEIDENQESDESDNEEEKKSETIGIPFTKKLRNIIKNSSDIVLLSATIDSHSDFYYYSYDLRDAIENGYLVDYQLICPIFNTDPTDKNIAEYLINKGELHSIVFAKNREEGRNFCNILNEFLPGCAMFVDYQTSKTDRKNIIEQFNLGNIRFLVNVRILTEGFNAPITDSVVFLHLPSNDTFVIQAIGRSLRLYNDKKISNVYLPFNTENDAKDIGNFLYTIANNDRVIKECYLQKNIETYINIEKVLDDKTNNTQKYENIQHKFDMIIDSIKFNKDAIWYTNFEKYKNYIILNNKRPSQTDNDENIRRLEKWFTMQLNNYKNKIAFMQDNTERRIKIDKLLNEYNHLFTVNDGKWNSILDKYKNYLDTYGKKPSEKDDNKNISFLGRWMTGQQKNYKNKTAFMDCGSTRRDVFETFLFDYKEYFMSYDEIWNFAYERTNLYIEKNNSRPSQRDKDKKIKYLGTWLCHQLEYYKNKTRGMTDGNYRYEKFKILLKKYPHIFIV